MTTKKPSRFDIETLRNIAGEKIFKRGEDYQRNGRVTFLDAKPERLIAKVAGTKNYRVSLTGQGKKINGECTCPNYETWGFCKHMVATALAADKLDGKMPEGGDTFSQIRIHLEAKDKAELIQMILDLAERDDTLFHKLEVASIASECTGAKAANKLRSALDRAIHVDDYLEYSEVYTWADIIKVLFETISTLIPAGQADLAMELALYAIDRLEEEMHHLDDSGVASGELMHIAANIHREAALVVRPDPQALAQELFAREIDDLYDTFTGSSRRYAEALGETGLREYRRLAQAQWDALPVLAKSIRGTIRHEGNYFRLFHILDGFANDDNDIEARISLRTKDLSATYNYLNLAQFCLDQGRDAEALRWAEEGLWVFEDENVDERLLLFTIDLLRKANRMDDAIAHLWCNFEKKPSFALYEQLHKIFGKQTYERAIALLAKERKKKATHWYYPADSSIRIAIREHHFDDAWGFVRKHDASIAVQESLAKASEKKFPREALAIYTLRVDQLVDAGHNAAYEEATELVQRMAPLQSKTAHTDYVTGLKTRFGRKRNFMKLLATL